MNREKIIILDKVIFTSKHNIDWDKVEAYLKRYVGVTVLNCNYNDKIHISREFCDEYSHSIYTKNLRGAYAKIKANMVQAIPEILQFAFNRKHQINHKDKHNKSAVNGWYRYNIKVAMPIYNLDQISNYNLYTCTILIKCGLNMRLKVYDIVDIRKIESLTKEEIDNKKRNCAPR